MPLRRVYALVFLALTFIYHSNLRPIASGESLAAALIPLSVVLHGAVTLDRFGPWIQEHVPYARDVVRPRGGHWRSVYPVAGPTLIAPLYLPLAARPGLRSAPPESLMMPARIAEKFAAVAMAALAAVWMLALLRRLTSPRWAWALAGMFALGTGVWSTASQALWPQTFGLVAIAACLYELDRGRLWRCGAWAGLAVLVHPANVVLAVALGLALRSRVAPVMGPVTVAALLSVWAGSGFGIRLDGNLAAGMAGLLVSPGRGLLFYTPVALFALACVAPAARPSLGKHRDLALAAGSFAVLSILLMSLTPNWWGGYCWGPRLLTEILPALVALMAVGTPAVSTRPARALFTAAALYGVAIQAIGVYCYPKGHWDSSPAGVDSAPARLWDFADNPIVRTAAAGPTLEPYDLAFTALRHGLPEAQKRMRELGIGGY